MGNMNRQQPIRNMNGIDRPRRSMNSNNGAHMNNVNVVRQRPLRSRHTRQSIATQTNLQRQQQLLQQQQQQQMRNNLNGHAQQQQQQSVSPNSQQRASKPPLISGSSQQQRSPQNG